MPSLDSKDDDDLVATLVTVPPDGGYGWIILVAAFADNFLLGIHFAFVIPLMMIGEDLHLNFNVLSTTMGILGFSYNVSCVLGSGLVNKYGYRCGSLLGTMFASGSLCTISYMNELYTIFLFHGVFSGIGFGLIGISSLLAVNHYFEKWRLLTSLASSCGSCVGLMVFPYVYMKILDNEAKRWRACTLFTSGIVFLVGLIASLWLKPLKPTLEMLPDDGKYRTIHDSTTMIRERAKLCCWLKKKREFPTVDHFRMSVPSNLVEIVNRSPPQSESGMASISIPEETTRCERMKRWLWCSQHHARPQVTFQSRPMYRDDIFYSTSMKKNPTYTKTMTGDKVRTIEPGLDWINNVFCPQGRNVNYHLAVSRTAMMYDVQDKPGYFCSVLSHAMWRVILSLNDFSLMRNATFTCFLFGSMCTSAGIYIFYVSFIEHGMKMGIGYDTTVWNYACIGLANIVGRIVFGFLITRNAFTGIELFVLSTVILTVEAFGNCYIQTSIQHLLFALLFGFFIASFHVVITDIVVNLIGLINLSSGFGLLLLFVGFGALLGMLTSGQVASMTGDIMVKLKISGIFYTIGTIFCVTIYIIKCHHHCANPQDVDLDQEDA